MPLIMIGSLVLTLYCTKLLLECADHLQSDSFSDIADAAYGPKMKRLTEILIICSQLGFCINYIYFISSQIGSIFTCSKDGADASTCGLAAEVKENFQLWYFLPALMVVYLPLVWIRNIDTLAFTHLIGDVIIVTVVVVIMVYSGMEMGDNDPAI